MSKEKSQSIERPPVVVVMGHVDHGKSTLLDFIRKSNIVAKEAGGITQHVAAYEVVRPSTSSGQAKRITFIDTPGHAAFKAIRARGANVADIAILVVAADDGVKAQTLEALQSIREAKIPFIVAINKIDKPNASIERTQATLLEKEVFLEKLGGDVPWVPISAKVGTGVDELLDLILIVAEFQDFKADPSVLAEGYLIEAHRDPKRGIAATLIITNGTLHSGEAVLAGRAVSPVRIMENSAGKSMREATFSSPVLLIGFDKLPDVGEKFQTFRNKKSAEDARNALPIVKAQDAITEEREGRFSLPVIIRADRTGSLEAIVHELSAIADEHAKVTIVQSGIGAISENDVKAAMASNPPAIIVGFSVAADAIAIEKARQASVGIELFDIIYKLTERLQGLLRESAPERTVEEVVGKAKVLKQFGTRKDEHVIGGSVSDGYLAKGGHVRVMRRNVEVGVGKIRNIQANKQNVDRIEEGREFGAQIICDFEVAQGDILENFITVTK